MGGGGCVWRGEESRGEERSGGNVRAEEETDEN